MATESGMDNSGQRPLSVPGFGERSLYEELSIENCFSEAIGGWEQQPALTAPEMAMLELMRDLTSKADWNIDIFNDEIVAKWREEVFRAQEAPEVREALGMRLISEKSWDWCILELRDKAPIFEENKFIRLFDAGSAVCISDALVSNTIRLALKDCIAPMLKKSASSQNQTLVDPSLFPLVYGKTSVLMEGQVGLLDRSQSRLIGLGKLSPKHNDERHCVSRVALNIKEDHPSPFYTSDLDEIRLFNWSPNFQLLPCEVEFYGPDTDVRITSYINNLHPIHYESVYHSIEKLISPAIKLWNDCLVKGGKGRWPIRIRTYGLTWEPEYPPLLKYEVCLGCGTDKCQGCETDACKETMREAEQFLKLPNYGSDQPADLPEDWNKHFRRTKRYVDAQWRHLHKIHYPEPGLSFSYNDWKDGRNGVPIIERNILEELGEDIQPDTDHEFYSIKLEDMFRRQGLQVIVEIGSIEPSYTDDWHVDSLNEHIIAKAIYFYDVENVVETRISFRQRARIADQDYHYNKTGYTAYPDEYEPFEDDMEAMLGFKVADIDIVLPLQQLGSISAPQGRLITWPTTLQHRVEPVALVDDTIPGHRRYVMMFLVDPYYRICSTRNVPPQGQAWWAEEVHDLFALRGIPREIAEMITNMADAWPIGMDEARQDQEQLITERKWAEAAFNERMALDPLSFRDNY